MTSERTYCRILKAEPKEIKEEYTECWISIQRGGYKGVDLKKGEGVDKVEWRTRKMSLLKSQKRITHRRHQSVSFEMKFCRICHRREQSHRLLLGCCNSIDGFGRIIPTSICSLFCIVRTNKPTNSIQEHIENTAISLLYSYTITSRNP